MILLSNLLALWGVLCLGGLIALAGRHVVYRIRKGSWPLTEAEIDSKIAEKKLTLLSEKLDEKTQEFDRLLDRLLKGE